MNTIEAIKSRRSIRRYKADTTVVKRPAKCEKFLCQKSYSFQGFQPFLTKELNCEK